MGSYTLASPSSVSGVGMVDFSNATLSGTSVFNSALTLSGPGTWNEAELTFPVTGVTIDATNSPNGESQLNQDTLTVAAGHAVSFVGTGNFDLGNGAAIVNSGTFAAQNNQFIDDNFGGAVSAFNNNGTFLRNTGTGTFTVGNGVTFTNTGTVNVQTGTLDLAGGDNGLTTGSFIVGPGVLQFDGTSTRRCFSFSGAGMVNFASGTVTVSGTSNLTGTTNFDGATLVASGKPAFNGPISWTGGLLTGTGTFFANGGMSINATNNPNGENQLTEATLVNTAGHTATFAGTGNLDLGDGATLVNSGTFAAQNNQFIDDNFGGAVSAFNNNGTFLRNTGTGTFTVTNGVTFTSTRDGQRTERDAGPARRRRRT